MVRILLDAGVQPDTRDLTFAQTPLLLAAEKVHAAVAGLPEYGANPNDADNHRQAPLAADIGHEFVVSLLLAHNVIPVPKNNTGKIIILLVAEKGHQSIVRSYLFVGWTQAPGVTPVEHCCHGQRPVAMKRLSSYSSIMVPSLFVGRIRTVVRHFGGSGGMDTRLW